MNHFSLPELLMPFPHAQKASLYRKIKAMPTVTGVLYCETLAIGERHSQALFLFGPGCTFETWEAAEGKPIQGSDTALTNPLRATAWASIPDSSHLWLNDFIRAEERASLEELPRLWVGHGKRNDIRPNDLFLRDDGLRTLKVLTFVATGARFLVCPLESYSSEREEDKTHIDFGYMKNRHMWEWKTLTEILDAHYTIVSDKTGEVFCRLVRNKEDERGIDE